MAFNNVPSANLRKHCYRKTLIISHKTKTEREVDADQRPPTHQGYPSFLPSTSTKFVYQTTRPHPRDAKSVAHPVTHHVFIFHPGTRQQKMPTPSPRRSHRTFLSRGDCPAVAISISHQFRPSYFSSAIVPEQRHRENTHYDFFFKAQREIGTHQRPPAPRRTRHHCYALYDTQTQNSYILPHVRIPKFVAHQVKEYVFISYGGTSQQKRPTSSLRPSERTYSARGDDPVVQIPVSSQLPKGLQFVSHGDLLLTLRYKTLESYRTYFHRVPNSSNGLLRRT